MVPVESGSSGLFPVPSPLRTERAGFLAHGSSISRAIPCGKTRLFISFSDNTHSLSYQKILPVLEVRLPTWIVRVSITPDLGVSNDCNAFRVEQFINLLLTLFIDHCRNIPGLLPFCQYLRISQRIFLLPCRRRIHFHNFLNR